MSANFNSSTNTVDDLLPALEEWCTILGDKIGHGELELTPKTCESVAETYIAAAVRRCRVEFLKLAEMLLSSKPTQTLELAIAKTKSFFARHEGDFASSDETIKKALEATAPASNVLTQALITELRLSQVENAMLQGDSTRALELFTNAALYKRPDLGSAPSELDFVIMRKVQTVRGRIFHNLGNFPASHECFNICKTFCEERSDRATPHLTRHLANSLMELDRCSEAKQILQKELDKCPSSTRAYRRLKLSYSSAELALGNDQECRDALNEWSACFHQTHQKDQNDEIDDLHARMNLIVLHQRSGRWDELIQVATEALEFTQTCTSFPPRDYYRSRIYMWRAGAQYELAQIDMRCAAACQQTPLNFVVRFGTYERAEQDLWLRKLAASIASGQDGSQCGRSPCQ